MSCEGRRHILSLENISIGFDRYEQGLRKSMLTIIRDLQLYVHEGELVAVVGASGSGKSVLAHAILGILPPNAVCCGCMKFDEEELTPERLEQLRGREMVLIPQSVSYLDPLMKVGAQVSKGDRSSRRVRRQRELFERYGLQAETAALFPFELSGGMARRVLISAATVEAPKLIIADEPTPGLHETVAAETIRHLRELADEGSGVLLITHDLELALQVADRVAVIYAGTVVEEALAEDFLYETSLRHPYTKALWRALPQNGFHPLPGSQPHPYEVTMGCPFRSRCESATPDCSAEIENRLIRCGTVRCIHADEVE